MATEPPSAWVLSERGGCPTRCVSLDCDDPLELGSFWARVLGGEVAFQSEKTVIVRSDWVRLAALKVDDYRPPTWPAYGVPKQIHLDLSVEDLDAAAVEAVQAGARIAVSAVP